MKLIWTSAARQNLQDLLFYIAKDSPQRAFFYAQKIEKRSIALKKFPGLGRHVPEVSSEFPDLREIIIDSYRLFYRVSTGSIEIVMVFHGKRDVHRLSKNRSPIVSEKVVRLTTRFMATYTQALQKLTAK